jgi:hypothetical protein
MCTSGKETLAPLRASALTLPDLYGHNRIKSRAMRVANHIDLALPFELDDTDVPGH